MAERLLEQHDPQDRLRIFTVISRELAAQDSSHALQLPNALGAGPDPVHGPVLSNPDFDLAPTGEGFDWRILSNPGIESSWIRGDVTLNFSGTQADVVVLVEQKIPVARGRTYRVQAPASSLTWELNVPAADGVATLRCVYRRRSGTIPLRGEIHLGKIRIDVL